MRQNEGIAMLASSCVDDAARCATDGALCSLRHDRLRHQVPQTVPCGKLNSDPHSYLSLHRFTPLELLSVCFLDNMELHRRPLTPPYPTPPVVVADDDAGCTRRKRFTDGRKACGTPTSDVFPASGTPGTCGGRCAERGRGRTGGRDRGGVGCSER